MPNWKSKAAIGLVFLMIAAACSGAEEEIEPTPEPGSEPSATTTAASEPPATETTRPPAAAATNGVTRTDGVSGPDIENMTVWAPTPIPKTGP